MSIKSEEAHTLAKALAAETGETLTGAVTTSLRERRERLHEAGAGSGLDARAERLLAIGRDAARRLKGPARTVDHGELLYDDRGLPR